MDSVILAHRDLLIPAAVLAVLLLTFLKRDAWPLTRYPMFSRYQVTERIRVFRLVFQKHDGSLDWWKPRYYRHLDTISPRIGPAASPADRLYCISEALRLMRLEQGKAPAYTAVQIVERTFEDGKVRDRMWMRIPLSGAPGAR